MVTRMSLDLLSDTPVGAGGLILWTRLSGPTVPGQLGTGKGELVKERKRTVTMNGPTKADRDLPRVDTYTRGEGHARDGCIE